MLLDIPSIVKSDLARSDTSSREFHVTSMSADLANAIARHVSSCKRPVPSAFDVGTGSGLHAVTCAACGIDRILAIDISGEAVELAKQRFERIGSELRRLEQPVAIPEFVCADFASMPSQTGQFSLVMSNPPSFFFCDLEDEDKSPLWYALFDGPKGDASNPRSSFIYRFFDTAVRKFLEPGGTVFCMWPAIERRLTSSEFGPLVHPAELLQHGLAGA